MKKTILILSYSELNNDPRVRRQINALKEDYHLITAGLSAFENKDIEFHSIDNTFKLKAGHYQYPFLIKKTISFFIILNSFFRKMLYFLLRKVIYPISYKWYGKIMYWSPEKHALIRNLEGKKIDLILANDLEALPLAYRLAGGTAKLMFDAHEYSPGENDTNEHWLKYRKRWVTYLCRKYLPLCDLMLTVCEGIAKEYETHFGVKPIVITNATDYKDLLPVKPESGRIKMIHHGAAIAERHIELMIQMMDLLDERFTLDLMLIPTQPDYLEKIKAMVQGKARVRLLPPVATEEISAFTNGYDVGLFLLPPVNFNYEHALPNKLFEFIQARLVVAIGPSPEMARFVKKYDLGIVSEDFTPQSLAKQVGALNETRISHYKAQCHLHAFELSSARNKEKILELVRGMV
jgi:hypothetical protein